MALSTKVLIINTPTATGNQPYTGAGFQPKAAIAFLAPLNADGFGAGGPVGWGFAASSTQDKGVGASANDNVATTASANSNDNNLVSVPTPAGGYFLRGSLVSFDADGLTINWLNVQGTAQKVYFLLLGGADLTNAFVGTTALNTVTGNQDFSGVGFQGDFAFFASVSSGTAASLDATRGMIGLGAAVSSTARWALGLNMRDAQTTAFHSGRTQRTDRCMRMLTDGGSFGALDWEADFVSWLADGFRLNILDAPSTGWHLHYLVLKFATPATNVAVGASAKPTGGAPVNQDASVGFAVKAALWASFGLAAVTTIQEHAGVSVGAGDGSIEAAAWFESRNLINTDVNRSTIGTKALRLATSPSTVDAEADHDLAAVSNGWRLTWTTNNAVAAEILYVAFGQPGIQLLRPTSDISAGLWTAVPSGSLFATIDEVVVDDADYNYSSLTPQNDAFRVGLGAGSTPATRTAHKLRWRIGKDATGGEQIDAKVRVFEGTTLRAEFTRLNVSAAATYEELWSQAQMDSVGNYGNLRTEVAVGTGDSLNPPAEGDWKDWKDWKNLKRIFHHIRCFGTRVTD